MTSVLMHTCCAPCSLSCIDPLRAEGIEPVAFWYNPNIHPWKEYEARRDCLLTYAPTIEMQVIVDEDYGLRTFVEHVASDIGHRCTYCYQHRLEETARYAAEHGYESFTSTLLASLYQDHDGIKAAAEKYARQYGVEFLYRGFPAQFPGRKSAGQRAWLLYAEVLRLCLFRTGPLPEADRPGQEKICGAGISPPRFVAERSF